MRTAELVFYIGNGIVKGGVVIYDKQKKPLFLTTRMRELPYFETIDRDQIENRIFSELNELCLEIKQKDLTKPICKGISLKDAAVMISSPWYISQTKNIHISHDKPFTITQELIDKTIDDVAKPYIGNQAKNIEILEQKIIKISLNGYPTNEPLKKKASTMDVSIFLSFITKDARQIINDTINKHFHFHTVEIHSQSYASYFVIESTWKDIQNYVLTDITSEVTELIIVRNNVIAEASSFPLGKHFIVRQLTKKLNTTLEVGASLLQQYQDKKLDETLLQRIAEALTDIKKEWISNFTKALSDMSVEASIPSKFFLFCPKDAVWIFTDFIKGEEYQQFSFSEGKFEVYDVGITDMIGQCAFSTEAHRDLSLAVISIFMHTSKINK